MGNANNNTPNFPAGYSGVISVGSTDPDDTRSNPFFWSPTSGSNYGSYISVIAPGNYIYGLHYLSNTNYDYYWGGTSQATPHVAGLAALLLAQDMTRTPAQIKTIIENTAQDQVGDPVEDTPGWDQYYGWGRINANAALNYNPQMIQKIDTPGFTLLPNPSYGRFVIKTDDPPVKNAEIIITDLLGKVLFHQVATSPLTMIDFSDKVKGVYFVTYMINRTNDGFFVNKIILK
jgi:thermitase